MAFLPAEEHTLYVTIKTTVVIKNYLQDTLCSTYNWKILWKDVEKLSGSIISVTNLTGSLNAAANVFLLCLNLNW